MGGTGFEPVAPTMSTKFPSEIGPQSLVSRGCNCRTTSGTTSQRRGITSQIPPKEQYPSLETRPPANVCDLAGGRVGPLESISPVAFTNNDSSIGYLLKIRTPAIEQPGARESFRDKQITRGVSDNPASRLGVASATTRNAWLIGRVYWADERVSNFHISMGAATPLDYDAHRSPANQVEQYPKSGLRRKQGCSWGILKLKVSVIGASQADATSRVIGAKKAPDQRGTRSLSRRCGGVCRYPRSFLRAYQGCESTGVQKVARLRGAPRAESWTRSCAAASEKNLNTFAILKSIGLVKLSITISRAG